MEIKKVLFPSRFREQSLTSLEPLFVLKEAGLREIILCHVIKRESVSFVPFGGYMREEYQRLAEEARIRFEGWQKSIGEAGISSSISIREGIPVHEILALAEAEDVDLLVVGKKKVPSFVDTFMGSQALDIMVRSTVPVLVSKFMVEYTIEGQRFTRINDKIFERPLVLTDFSEGAEKAVEFASALKGAVEGMVLCHVLERKQCKVASEDGSLQPLQDECSEKLEVQARILRDAGIDCDVRLAIGDTAEEILRTSREAHASMIIMGTTGKTAVKELLSGSVSHAVTYKSELPTLLVPRKRPSVIEENREGGDESKSA